MAHRIILSPPERRELTRMSRRRGGRLEDVRRAKVVLALASGAAGLREIARRERCSVNTVSKWRDRFLESRLPGLLSRHRGRKIQEGSEKLQARIIDWTLHRKPAGGSTQWSCRKLAAALGVNHVRVARVWAKAGLQPHRRRHYMASDDADFEAKAADIIGLYLKPPVHAAETLARECCSGGPPLQAKFSQRSPRATILAKRPVAHCGLPPSLSPPCWR